MNCTNTNNKIKIQNNIDNNNRAIYGVFHMIMFLIAIFLSLRCNNGFNLGSFLVAFIFPYIYIFYILITEYDNGLCDLITKK